MFEELRVYKSERFATVLFVIMAVMVYFNRTYITAVISVENWF